MKKFYPLLLTCLTLVAGLIGTPSLAVTMESTPVVCDAELDPWITGSAMDKAGAALSGTMTISIFGQDGNDEPAFIASKESQVANDGKFQVCPPITGESQGLSYPPNAVENNPIWLGLNHTNQNGSNLDFNKVLLSKSLADCFNAGGPCLQNFTEISREKLKLEIVDSAGSQLNSNFQVTIYKEHELLDKSLGFTEPIGSAKTSNGNLAIGGLDPGNYVFGIEPLSGNDYMSKHFLITIKNDYSISWQVFDWKYTKKPLAEVTNLAFGESIKLTPLMPRAKINLAGNGRILSASEFQDFGELPTDTIFMATERIGTTNEFNISSTCLDWPIQNYELCGMWNWQISSDGTILLDLPDGYFTFFTYPKTGASELLLYTKFVIQLLGGELVGAWAANDLLVDTFGAVSEVYKPISINLVAGVKSVSFNKGHSLGQAANPSNENFAVSIVLKKFGQTNDDIQGSTWGSSLQTSNTLDTSQGPKFILPDVRSLGISCNTSNTGASPELKLTADPSWSASMFRKTEFAFDCAVNSGVYSYKIYDLKTDGTSDTSKGALSISSLPLKKFDLSGVVVDQNNQPMTEPSISLYPYDLTNKLTTSWSNWQNTGFDISSSWDLNNPGKFNFYGTKSGYYLVVAEKGGNPNFTWGSIIIETVADINGKLTAVYQYPDKTNNLITSGQDITIKFNSPNFVGSSKFANGSPNKWGYAELSHWNNSLNGYTKQSGAPYYIYFNSKGEFSAYLEPGRHKVTPKSYSSMESSPGYEVWVDKNNNVCNYTNQINAETLCTSSTASWSLDMTAPNVTGKVTFGSSNLPLTNSWYSLEKISTYWNYVPSASTTMTDQNGAFGMLIQDPGYYRLKFSSSNIANNENNVDTYVYFARDSSSRFCAVSENSNFSLSPSCINGTPTLSLNIGMETSNLKVAVTVPGLTPGTTSPSKYTQVSLRDVTDQNVFTDVWRTDTYTQNNGVAQIKLPTSMATKYFEIIAYPPYSAQGNTLSQKKIEVCSKNNKIYSVINKLCSDSEISEVKIDLNSGSIVGQVFDNNGLQITSSWPVSVDVSKWTNLNNANLNSWGWSFSTSQINVNQLGKFSGNLDDGIYRIRATSNVPNLASTSTAIRVATVSGVPKWCRIVDNLETRGLSEWGNTESAIGTCTPGFTSSTNLGIRLSLPNVTGSLSGPTIDGVLGSLIDSSYIYAYAETTTGYNSLGYSTVRNGKFGLRLPLAKTGSTKNYRLDFSPPYDKNYSKLSVAIICTSTTCTYKGTSTLNMELAFPSPNLSGVVCGSNSTLETSSGQLACEYVKYAYVSVEKWNGVKNYWEWQDINSQTGSTGRFSLNLPTGKFRIRFNPPADNSVGVASYATVEVGVDTNNVAILTGDGEVSSTSTLEAKLQSQNLKTSLNYKSSSGEIIPMPFGSISAYIDCSKFDTDSEKNECTAQDPSLKYAWSQAARSGEANLLLGLDGTWNVTAYSNYSKVSKLPVQMLAEVKNGIVTNWKYKDGGTSATIGFINFDEKIPNLNISLSGTSQMRNVQFYRYTSGNWSLDSSLNSVTSGGSSNKLEIFLPVGERFKVKILRTSRESSVGEISEFTVSSSTQNFTVPVR